MTEIWGRAFLVFVVFWLACLAALMSMRLLSGGLPLQGLLSDAEDGQAPERLLPLGGAAFALGQWALSALAETSGPPAIAEFPQEALWALGAGQISYLAGKGLRRYRNRRMPS